MVTAASLRSAAGRYAAIAACACGSNGEEQRTGIPGPSCPSSRRRRRSAESALRSRSCPSPVRASTPRIRPRSVRLSRVLAQLSGAGWLCSKARHEVQLGHRYVAMPSGPYVRGWNKWRPTRPACTLGRESRDNNDACLRMVFGMPDCGQQRPRYGCSAPVVADTVSGAGQRRRKGENTDTRSLHHQSVLCV
jgi:hypothetical protein